MQKIKNQTYKQIIQAKSKGEIEAVISLVMYKLTDHNVNKHIINRFILKLQRKLNDAIPDIADDEKRILLVEGITFLDRVISSKQT